jgi:uncharacterized protein
LEDIAALLEQMSEAHPSITLMFHGGEPLLRFDELRRICAFAADAGERHKASVSFLIQTNGSLLDEDKVQFLRERQFGVGMSIDGPPEVNDRTRVTAAGRGTGEKMEQLFDRYPEFMRTEVGYITTVTSRNVDSLQTIAEYLRGLGVRSWKTAIFDPEGRGKDHPEFEVPLEPYIGFLEWAVAQCAKGLWAGFRMKTVLDLLQVIMTAERPNLCMKFPCGAGREFAVAGADKTVLACDATDHAAFRLGPLQPDTGFPHVSSAQDALSARESWLLEEAECSQCPWLHFCAGTCMAKALIRHGTIKAVDDFECSVRKRLFPLLFAYLIEPESGLLAYYMDDATVGGFEAATAKS